MPMRKNIRYKGGYKYQLVEPYVDRVPIHPAVNIATLYISLSTEGELEIGLGYAWDGPSGPTIDTKDFMRGSLVHDVLYQLMREGWLSREEWKEPADRLLRKMCIEDGMWRLRAWWVYIAVAKFGRYATFAKSGRKVLVAPGVSYLGGA